MGEAPARVWADRAGGSTAQAMIIETIKEFRMRLKDAETGSTQLLRDPVSGAIIHRAGRKTPEFLRRSGECKKIRLTAEKRSVGKDRKAGRAWESRCRDSGNDGETVEGRIAYLEAGVNSW